MPRLVDWPLSIPFTAIDGPYGPASVNSGTQTAQSGLEASYSTPGAPWRFRMSMGHMQRGLARLARGTLYSGANGANWYRMRFTPGARRTLAEAGATTVTWDDVEWSEGGTWGLSYPLVTPAVFMPADTAVITLTSEAWGHDLEIGEFVGWTGHFGAYVIEETFGGGQYRIWPPLRSAVVASEQRCTLEPVMAVKLVSNSYNIGMSGITASGMSAEFVEVFDYQVQEQAT